MAAYGAIMSLMHTIEQIQQHPLPPVYLDEYYVESLIKNVTFLQGFLAGYSSGRSDDGVETRVAEAACAAEDIIESYIAQDISSTEFYQGLRRSMEDMESIKEEVMVMETKEKSFRNPTAHVGSSRQSIIVGLDEVSNEIMEKLIGEPSDRLIVAIVGIGGIGKTTLARNIYLNQLIVKHFDLSVWVTISLEFNAREIFLQVLLCLSSTWSPDKLSRLSEDELGRKMFQMLWGRRYLIVMDDTWSIEAWNEVDLFFPENKNGSRIMVTTRLYNVATELTIASSIFRMNFLDDNKSWNLFCKKVFGEGDCPLELEEIGMEIARNCKGLPLSIVVIAGLLGWYEKTREYWEYIAENISSIVNLEDDERCLKILKTSYNQLPIYLKPCFLYLGIYPQNHVIRVSLLVKLWVAEGFLKPIGGKSLEVVAEEYLDDLIGRNLIIVCKLASDGKIKLCKVHDLLRDLCLRQAQKEKFLCVTRRVGLGTPQGMNTKRCVGIHRSILKEENLPQFASLNRLVVVNATAAPQSGQLALLRVMRAVHNSYAKGKMDYTYSLEDVFRLVNIRFLAVRPDLPISSVFPSSVCLLWNVQTLIIHSSNLIAPPVIWMMPQLRHVMFGVLDLPDPPSGPTEGRDEIILENLQTLSRVNNFKCGEEVVKRIRNVKKLKVYYEEFRDVPPNYYLNNLGHLHHLESLSLSFTSGGIRNYLLQSLTFPHSLRKLTLEASLLHWEDMATMIGPLPLLQVLKLRFSAFVGPEWETVEGQFCSLKFLLIDTCLDFESWITESSHFPLLEHLILRDLEKLIEIPLGIGDIPTLQSIELDRCSDSTVISAKEIVDEQEALGNEDLQVRVKLWKKNEELECLATGNFQVSR